MPATISDDLAALLEAVLTRTVAVTSPTPGRLVVSRWHNPIAASPEFLCAYDDFPHWGWTFDYTMATRFCSWELAARAYAAPKRSTP